MASIEKDELTVFGYVRTNYNYSVPDVITRLCLKYYRQKLLSRFKNKAFQKLAMEKNELIKFEIIFNPDLILMFGIAPNGLLDKSNVDIVKW